MRNASDENSGFLIPLLDRRSAVVLEVGAPASGTPAAEGALRSGPAPGVVGDKDGVSVAGSSGSGQGVGKGSLAIIRNARAFLHTLSAGSGATLIKIHSIKSYFSA